eukprot:261158-Pleurochrysis_carterae.AAC.3
MTRGGRVIRHCRFSLHSVTLRLNSSVGAIRKRISAWRPVAPVTVCSIARNDVRAVSTVAACPSGCAVAARGRVVMPARVGNCE